MSETGPRAISIHRFAQSTRLNLMTLEERQEAFDVALSILATCFPKQVLGSHMHELYEGCEAFLPHVLAFEKAVQEKKPSFLQRDAEMYVNMMCDVTWYLWEIGQHNEALRLLDSAESICSQTIGLDTLEAARIFVNRGSVFSTLNKYRDAGLLFEKALDIRSGCLPDGHQLLANSYMQMGNYYLNTSSGTTGVENAIHYHQKVVNIRLSSPATEPAVMINSYLNLCRSLMKGGRLGDAETYLGEAERIEGQLRDSPQTRNRLEYRHQ